MKRKQRRVERGFTLMEVLLVLVILVILGSLSVSMFTGTRREAQIKAAKSQIGLLKTPLDEFNLEIGSYPTTGQGLQGLSSPPGDLRNPAKWRTFVDKPVPLDPWDNAYQYQSPGSHNPEGYDLWSTGLDGQNGTADDIGNW